MSLPEFPFAFYPVAVVAILLVGISKGGLPVGAAGIGVPLMSIFIAPPEAAAILLPILGAMDRFGVHAQRRRWSAHHLKVLLPGALVGIVAGGLAFGTLPVNAVRLLVGIIAVVFVVNYVKLIPYAMLGQLNAGNPTASLVFAPLAPLGIRLGVWLHRRLSERASCAISYALRFASGVKLIFDGIAG